MLPAGLLSRRLHGPSIDEADTIEDLDEHRPEAAFPDLAMDAAGGQRRQRGRIVAAAQRDLGRVQNHSHRLRSQWGTRLTCG